MSIASLHALLDALRQDRLLEPQQLEALNALDLADSESLAKDLIQRGWLTPFQADQLLDENGQKLVLGQYVLLERLGKGGTGQVFKARHRFMDRIVAVKLIRSERLGSPQAVQRFVREVRAIAALSHPNIVLAYDADEIDGTHLMAMEYMEGAIDLAMLVKQAGPLPVAQAGEYIRQAALGLQYASECGMVHRDIKPANLLLTAGGRVVKILDMGLVRLDRPGAEDDPMDAMTQEGSVMGTPDYIAPEQAIDTHTVDIRADLYSLGCTFYFLLVGRTPFPGGSFTEKLLKHQLQEPLPVEQLRPGVPPEVAAVVRKLMAKKPADRYQTPAELLVALASASLQSSGPVSAVENALMSSMSSSGSPREHATIQLDGPREMLLSTVSLRNREETVTLVAALEDKPQTFTNSIGIKFVWAPPGSFMMGSPKEENERQANETLHQVTLTKGFYLGVCTVTQEQWQAVMGDNPGHFKGEKNLPVEQVSWLDCQEFCKKLQEIDKKPYRLPTEAEWEYACRARTNTTFHFGETLSTEQANYSGQAAYGKGKIGVYRKKTTPVGTFPANAFGLHDMHGNLWEWCQDWFGAYPDGDATDPQGPATGTGRVLRGGSWGNLPGYCRSACRLSGGPGNRGRSVGFRLCFALE